MENLPELDIKGGAPPFNFFNYSPEGLQGLLEKRFSEPRFRVDQLYRWVYRQRIDDPLQMLNIKQETRERFKQEFVFPQAKIHTRKISVDGTRKYLFEVGNGDLVESVMIKQPERMTLCISSQVGCAMGCTFCQTGTMGLKRQLETWEIVAQILAVIEDAKNFGDMFNNIVFMGMGEPLHNVDAVLNTLRILKNTNGLCISPQRSTVSTSGLVPAIKKFGDSGVEACLAVSLNATTDEVRSRIMPVNRKYPIAVLLDALRSYPLKPRKRITIEYVMLRGVNDSPDDMQRLPKLLQGIPCKVNLIPYNLNPALGFEASPNEVVFAWQKYLNQCNYVATIRWSKGADIQAACGQLVTESGRVRIGARPSHQH